MTAGGGHKKRFQYCTDSSGTILFLRALQGYSGRNLLDPSLQDNVVIPDGFFKYIYHVGCAINFTFHRQFRVDTWRSKLEQQTDSILSAVNPMDKNHKDPDTIDLNAPRHAQYMHKAWKKHRNTVYWVDIKLAQKKGFKFFQTRSNAMILYDTLPAYYISKAIMMETGDVICEKVNASPRPPPKISCEDMIG